MIAGVETGEEWLDRAMTRAMGEPAMVPIADLDGEPLFNAGTGEVIGLSYSGSALRALRRRGFADQFRMETGLERLVRYIDEEWREGQYNRDVRKPIIGVVGPGCLRIHYLGRVNQQWVPRVAEAVYRRLGGKSWRGVIEIGPEARCIVHDDCAAEGAETLGMACWRTRARWMR